jgi:DnaJ family protein C protein 2
VRSRHTYERFVWRYSENGGAAVTEDLILHLEHIPAQEEALAAAQLDPRMLKLDPNEWKKQDHYMVLGLEDKRATATAEDIRAAHRARVLLYHPDKIAQRNGEGKSKRQKDDAIFKCIQKAHQIISDPDKRAAFDSVDPTFDTSIPDEKLPAGACFYATYGPVFERNMRFSKNTTHLTLGGPDTPREAVEDFYRFWSNFESTRRFDYLDEDEVEGENREAKRYQEKKNKAARLKRKSEDNARIRQLFEQAYKLDPRIKAHKEADKAAKATKKNTPNVASGRPQSQAALLAEKKAKEEEAARVAAEAAKAAAAEAKKVKEAETNALRKEKKAFKSIFVEHNYFLVDLTNLKAFEEEAVLVEQICNRLARLEIEEVRGAVQAKVAAKDFGGVTNLLRERLGVALVERPAPVASMVSADTESANEPSPSNETWSFKETDLLINGTKKFPGGTVDRWETITEWLNRQLPPADAKTMEQVIAKANEIKAQGVHLAPEAREATGKRDPRVDLGEPTIAAHSVAGPWSADEQSALEAAIKAIVAEDTERWDKIAKLVATRTKKECMLRAKELATAAKSRQQQ